MAQGRTASSTGPISGGLLGGAFRDQAIGTAILLMPILALTDLLDNPPRADLAHCVIGLVVTATGMAFGADAGPAGAALYKLFIGFFLPTAGPEPPGRVPAPEG